MRRIAVLLIVLLASTSLVAVKHKKPEPSLDESLAYINKVFYPTMDYFYGCSEKIEVTLSEQHQELIITKLPVDGNGKVKKELPPMYIYRIPVADVKLIYPYGFSPYKRYDRIIIRTNGHAISKYGPYWDCFHRRTSKKTKLRMMDNAMLKIDDLDDSQLVNLLNALKRTVQLTQTEALTAQDQQPDAAAAPQQPRERGLDEDLDGD
jgi:hypothetical protein